MKKPIYSYHKYS